MISSTLRLVRIVAPNVGAIAFVLCLIDIALQLTYHVLPNAVENRIGFLWADTFSPASLILLAIAIAAGITTVATLVPIPPDFSAAQASDLMFARYLIGLGYFLLAISIANMIALVGLATNGHIDKVLKMGEAPAATVQTALANKAPGTATGSAGSPTEAKTPLSKDEVLRLKSEEAQAIHASNVVQGVVLLAALAMTLLGALSYFAISLWKKFKDPGILFNENIFWAGLWFRLAEAIVLTLAVFLFLRYAQKKELVGYLPMIGLFIGMTVKTSEALVFGLVEKVLGAVTGFVQAGGGGGGGGSNGGGRGGGAGGAGGTADHGGAPDPVKAAIAALNAAGAAVSGGTKGGDPPKTVTGGAAPKLEGDKPK